MPSFVQAFSFDGPSQVQFLSARLDWGDVFVRPAQPHGGVCPGQLASAVGIVIERRSRFSAKYAENEGGPTWVLRIGNK